MHSLRATAATNALSHNADIAKVQEWLGYANIATTRLYDQRNHRPEDSPTFRVAYETGHGGYTAIGRQRPSGGVGFTIRAPNHTPPRRTRSRFPVPHGQGSSGVKLDASPKRHQNRVLI